MISPVSFGFAGDFFVISPPLKNKKPAFWQHQKAGEIH
jgi:hypothetical protein